MSSRSRRTTLPLALPPPGPPPQLVKDLTEELAATLHAPVITFGAWGSAIPERVREEVILQRMVRLMKAKKEARREVLDLATDAEACAYLFSACMEFPFDHDWAQIYLYVAGKVMDGKVPGGIPADIRVTELTSDQERDLNHLKRWIVNQQRNHMKAKVKHERGLQGGNHNQPALPGGSPPAHNYRFDFGLKGD